jgi:hypothetical protein
VGEQPRRWLGCALRLVGVIILLLILGALASNGLKG